jgi:LacI family transcriptional regulator
LPTIKDVAEKAGVSVVTASRVINNVSTVRPNLRERVEQAIAELNYVPSAAARSLRSNKTRIIALVVPVIASSHWHGIIQGIEDAAYEHSYIVQLFSTHDNPKKQKRYLDAIISQNTAGVIIAPCDADPANLQTLRQNNIPTVIINRRLEQWDGDQVYSDNTSGSYQLTNHLLSLGHERIGIIRASGDISAQQDRVAGYCKAYDEAGLPIDRELIQFSDTTQYAEEPTANVLLDLPNPPTAIFATNDSILVNTLKVLNRRRLRIPDDIALVSFGELYQTYFPFITSVLEPARQLGINAAQLLFSRLENSENWQPRRIILPTQLILRQSCGRTPQLTEPVLFPSPDELQTDIQPIARMTDKQLQDLPQLMQRLQLGVIQPEVKNISNFASNGDLAKNALLGNSVTRLPIISMGNVHQTVLDEILNRSTDAPVKPEDHVEFARTIGVDAVACSIRWHYEQVKDILDMHNDLPLPMTDQMSRLESYVRATIGTGVGILVALHTLQDYITSNDKDAIRLKLHKIEQEAVQIICDRFQQDVIGFVLIAEPSAISDSTLPLWQSLIDQVRRYKLPTIVTTPLLNSDTVLDDINTTDRPVIETLNGVQLNSIKAAVDEINFRRRPNAERLINVDTVDTVDQLNHLIRSVYTTRK